MSDKEYWRSRSKEYEAALLAKCKSELEPQLKKLFRESLSAIEKDIESLYGRYQSTTGLSYAEARKILRGAEYSKWRLSLKEYVALSHKDSKILKELQTLAMRSRISRLEKLYSETLIELQKLGEQYEGAVKDFLTTAYKERYYRGIYDLATAGKLEIPATKVQPEKLENVLAIRWAGGNYSSRIWKNTEKLSQVLKTTLSQGLHRGLSVQKLSRELSQEMKVSYKNAERLARTELNFVQNHAAKESLEAAGLEEYEFIAVLDHRTSQRCQALDGTIHLLEEYDVGTNAPPMHPRCRSTISAVTEGGKRTARNSHGRNIKIPADWSYEKWRESIDLNRRTENTGAFADLKVPLQKRAVTQLCREYGVDISGLKIKIQRSEEWLRSEIAGATDYLNVGRIDLTPNAFRTEEQLLRTIIHEGCHVRQLQKYGLEYVQNNILYMEKVAYRYEDFFYRMRSKNGKFK